MQKSAIIFTVLAFITALGLSGAGAQHIPAALETLPGEDGSTWERISEPGFGSRDNLCVVSMAPFEEHLYALTRNEASGFEVWRTLGSAWEQISAPGFTDGALHVRMNNGYGALIEFNGHLYAGVGSGYEGAFLYNSVGLSIWRFDGTAWEPVVADSRDLDESGTLSTIAGCSAEDGDLAAEISDASKAWEPDQWAGGILRIVSGEGLGRSFEIVANSATTLTIQQNEISGTEEFTVCGAVAPDEDHPELIAGAVSEGDSYEICVGPDENGFGELWNKNFIDFEVFQDELYASIAHNYEDGIRIWKTTDGLSWEPVSDYSFGLFHGFDRAGKETGQCLIDDMEDRNGAPVCSSTTYFTKSSVSGTETLYVGGTGTSGCNGRGARVLRYDNGTWDFIVDSFVDDNDEGTNENGLGNAGSFLNSNFQAWSWADYDDHLFVGVARPVGCRVMFTATGSQEDGAWTYAAGGDAPVPDGFDGVGNFAGYGANLGMHLYRFGASLYAGTMANAYSPALLAGDTLDGADIWRATGPAQAPVWTRITSSGFGDPTILGFQAFCTWNGALVVAGSNLFGNFAGDPIDGYKGATVYRLKEAPDLLVPAAFSAEAQRTSIALRWASDNETGVTGFNVYRSSDPQDSTAYRKINRDLISARGAPGEQAAYEYIDTPLWFNRTYYYKVEAIGDAGSRSVFGPLPATTRKLFGN